MSTLSQDSAAYAGAHLWQPEAYGKQASRIAEMRIERSTRYGARNDVSAEAASVHLQHCAVDVMSSVRVPVTYTTLPGRCSDGVDVQLVDSDEAADC